VLRAVVIAAIGALCVCSPVLAKTATAVTCSTKGLSAGKAKVTEVQADGMSCTNALTVAREVAADVVNNRAVSVPGVSGFAMSTDSCIGCGGTTTKVGLTYASGAKLTISIRGGSSGVTINPGPTLPTPSIPSPGSGGSGPITV
jgi:hypothetical protein